MTISFATVCSLLHTVLTMTERQIELAKFKPQEIAYYVIGKGWKRTTAKTLAAFERKLDRLAETSSEIQVRDLEGAQ